MQKLVLYLLLPLILLVALRKIYAQDSTFHDNPYPTEINKSKLYRTIALESSFYFGGNAYLQYVWYKDSKRVPFHFYNDNSGYLQVDKFGHVFGSYVESYVGYKSLRNAGVSKKKALIYGAPLGLLLQTPIEIFDGIYENWGFSWGDMLANTAGSAIVLGNEMAFDEQLIKYKFTYSSSKYRDQSNGYLGTSALNGIFYDYNAHTYWLSMPINAIVKKSAIPNWLCVSTGYSANGMFGEFENRTSYHGVPIPETMRYRQFLLSFDIDWTKVETSSKFMRKLLDAMVIVKLPFSSFEIGSTGKMKGYWMYY